MKITVQVAYLVDQDDPAIELWVDDEMMAEVESKNNKLALIVYPQKNKKPWHVPLDEMTNALVEAQSKAVLILAK